MASARPLSRAVPRAVFGGNVTGLRPRNLAVLRSSSEASTASTSPSSIVKTPLGELVEDKDFAISKISFGTILTSVGIPALVWGFLAYFTLLPGADLSSVILIYAFPISVLGFALSYAQLEPVPCKTSKAAFALRDSQMTDIQKQIREDTTRFR